jgi:hypothetical protein
MFDRLVWQRDRMLLDDLVFRLEHYRSADWMEETISDFTKSRNWSTNIQISSHAARTSAPNK